LVRPVEVVALPTARDLLFDSPAKATTTIALANGAGGAMDSPFVDYIARALGVAPE
jgi:predicted alpha/beta-hydrolase family hydrolase